MNPQPDTLHDRITALHQPETVTVSVPTFDEYDEPFQKQTRCQECSHSWPCRTAVVLAETTTAQPEADAVDGFLHHVAAVTGVDPDEVVAERRRAVTENAEAWERIAAERYPGWPSEATGRTRVPRKEREAFVAGALAATGPGMWAVERAAEDADDLLRMCATTTNHSMDPREFDNASAAIWMGGYDTHRALTLEQVTSLADALWNEAGEGGDASTFQTVIRAWLSGDYDGPNLRVTP